LVKDAGCAGCKGLVGFHLRHGPALGVQHGGLHRHGLGHPGVVDHLGLHVGRGGLPGHLRRSDERAVPGHVQRRGDDEPHVAVDAAREGVLARAGREPGVPDVVHPHGQDIGAPFRRVGDIDGEPGVAPFVFAHALAVYEHLRHLKHAVEFEADAFVLPRRRHVEVFPVPAVADVEPVRREVRHGERVRQVRGLPRLVIEGHCLRVREVAEV